MKPPIKWAGGKRRQIPQLTQLADWTGQSRYVEPFLGGGALFFHLEPAKAIIADSNPYLINAYQQLAANPERTLEHLEHFKHAHSKEIYLAHRQAITSKPASTPEQAARFLYLNRTAYGGLWRENKAGQMNAPCSKDTPKWLPTSHYLSAAKLLAAPGVQIKCQPFQKTIAQAQKGDLIYADPPYIPQTNEFTAYQKTGFTQQDHERLAEALKNAETRGARWILSNSDTPQTRTIYKPANITKINASRCIGNPTNGQKQAAELILTSD